MQAAPIGGSAEHSEAIGVARHSVAVGNTLMVRLLGLFDWWAVYALILESFFRLATPTTASAVLLPQRGMLLFSVPSSTASAVSTIYFLVVAAFFAAGFLAFFVWLCFTFSNAMFFAFVMLYGAPSVIFRLRNVMS